MTTSDECSSPEFGSSDVFQIPVQADSIKPIKINVNSEFDHIILKTLPKNISIIVYYKGENKNLLLSQIPSKSSQDHLIVCYGNKVCSKSPNFTVSDDDILISTKKEQEFSDLMKLIEKQPDKKIQFLKLAFIGDIIEVDQLFIL
ncbi:hypothetical protein M9Y10_036551 [Tritrichomonas musculus]|uniref:Uncharacterized protein n=1 Tax=Tritrichomonas musculus TaxID=1915356 RepID=A0ABR2GUK6_9EUKA